MNINKLLRENRRNRSRGALMGDCGFISTDQPLTGLCCQRLEMIDGCYGPDATYWGAGSREHGWMYVIFNAGNDVWKPACGLLKYYRAQSRSDAIKQFNQEYPGYTFIKP